MIDAGNLFQASVILKSPLFSDFVGMSSCVRHMDIKKVLQIVVGKMVNDFVDGYQVRHRSFKKSKSREGIPSMAGN